MKLRKQKRNGASINIRQKLLYTIIISRSRLILRIVHLDCTLRGRRMKNILKVDGRCPQCMFGKSELMEK